MSARGRNEITELGVFGEICTTVQFVWWFVSWQVHGWCGICVLPTPGLGTFLNQGDKGHVLW